MKKFSLSGLLTCFVLSLFSQVPQAINYQAVARNASGIVIPNQNVSVRFTIRYPLSGAIEYRETDTVKTNPFGLFTVQLGWGTVQQGNFSTINWGDSAQYLEVDMDATGGTNYVSMGNTQLISVPYALYAKSAGNSWQNYASYDERVQTNYPPFTILTDSMWKPRVLNNTEQQVGTAITKNGNDITLAPGTYHITATAPWGWDIPYNASIQWGFPQAQTQLRVWNMTANAGPLLLSPSEMVTDTRNTLNGSTLHETYSLHLEGEITVTTQTVIELQHLIKSISWPSGPTNYEPGIPMNSGMDEIYATINIQKID
jgi:hypothetical protein